MKQSFLKKAQAFTLVELITVVTILAILSAIGFVSFSGYIAAVRDTNRLSQLTSVYDGLELYATKHDLPLPDDAIEIKYGNSLLGYQGNIGKNILDILDFSRGWVDPKDGSSFVYYLSVDKSHFQLMGFLEEEENVPTVFFPQAYANKDYSNLYPVVFGKKLGILLDEITQTPVHEIDVNKTVGELDLDGDTEVYTAYFKNNDTETDTGENLGEAIEEERNTTTTSSSETISNSYPWCNEDDIIIWSYTIAACNAWSSIAGIDLGSYGHYFQFWKFDNTLTDENHNGDWKHTWWENTGSANDWGVYDSKKTTATFASSVTADQIKMKGPCESGYHVPTYKEWDDLLNLGAWSSPSNMQSDLKLPYAWNKNSAGTSGSTWTIGMYYTSSPSWRYGYYLHSVNISFYQSSRNIAASIRCFKD